MRGSSQRQGIVETPCLIGLSHFDWIEYRTVGDNIGLTSHGLIMSKNHGPTPARPLRVCDHIGQEPPQPHEIEPQTRYWH